MPQFVAVSRDRHLSKRWRTASNYSFAAADALAPAVGSELNRLALATPLAFVSEAGSYRLMAVQSLEPGRNMFVASDGRWLGGYAPAFYSSYPFRLLLREGTDESILCIDEGGKLVVDSDAPGEAFFDVEGTISQATKEVLDYLMDYERRRKATQLAVSALAEAEIIKPWPIMLKAGQEERLITGLHRVDESALNALNSEAFLKLRKASALPVAYAQLLSTGQISMLERLATSHLSSSPAPASASADRESLDEIFKIGSYGLVRFE